MAFGFNLDRSRQDIESLISTVTDPLLALIQGKADLVHGHDAGDITTGILPVVRGGTGKDTLQGLRSAMGLGNTVGVLPVANGGTGNSTLQATRNAMGLGNTTGALPIANGGTGKTTVAAARQALGLGNTSGPVPAANGGTGKTYGYSWQQLLSWTGSATKTLTLTGYSEIMVLARCSTTKVYSRAYLGSVIIPIGILDSTLTEMVLGGGGTSSGGRYFSVAISSSKIQTAAAIVDNDNCMSSTLWRVYAR